MSGSPLNGPPNFIAGKTGKVSAMSPFQATNPLGFGCTTKLGLNKAPASYSTHAPPKPRPPHKPERHE